MVSGVTAPLDYLLRQSNHGAASTSFSSQLIITREPPSGEYFFHFISHERKIRGQDLIGACTHLLHCSRGLLLRVLLSNLDATIITLTLLPGCRRSRRTRPTLTPLPRLAASRSRSSRRGPAACSRSSRRSLGRTAEAAELSWMVSSWLDSWISCHTLSCLTLQMREFLIYNRQIPRLACVRRPGPSWPWTSRRGMRLPPLHPLAAGSSILHSLKAVLVDHFVILRWERDNLSLRYLYYVFRCRYVR